MTHPPVCDYEGSDYQSSFWDQGGREYEDRVEAIALKRLLSTPALAGGARESGRLMLEVGAGAGRNTPRYVGFERIVLLDYSRTQLEQAQQRLGKSDKYIYVAADAYRLPFVDGLFGAATMIRTLHHMADAPKALKQIRNVLAPNAIFILEFANKLNLKAMVRYWLKRQAWSPFTLEPVEFAKLNFDFHPTAITTWLNELGFRIEKTLTVSHFRIGFLKRIVPTSALVLFDSLLQWTGAFFQWTPSVFIRCRCNREGSPRTTIRIDPTSVTEFFRCPECSHAPLDDKPNYLECPNCKRKWGVQDGIYDFRMPMKS